MPIKRNLSSADRTELARQEMSDTRAVNEGQPNMNLRLRGTSPERVVPNINLKMRGTEVPTNMNLRARGASPAPDDDTSGYAKGGMVKRAKAPQNRYAKKKK